MAFQAISKLDPVSRNCIWEEHVKKERKCLNLTESFMISNPDKMTILPDKPNYVLPSALLAPQAMHGSTAFLATVTPSTSSSLPPPERFDLPRTANNEYGFFSYNNAPHPSPLFDKPLGTCDVTSYATAYTRMTGRSPYLKKQDGIVKKA